MCALCIISFIEYKIIIDPPVPGSSAKKNKYFELKKLVGRRWGAPNSNYLLVIVPTFVMRYI